MPSVLKSLTFLLALLLATGGAWAQERVTLITSGFDKAIYLPARLAMQLGYFTEQGLDVSLQAEVAGAYAEDALLAGAAQGVIGAYDHTIDLQARGKAVQSVVQLTVSPGQTALVPTALADQVRSPADFKGRRIGVTALGSSTSFLMQYLGELHGVKPSAYTLVPVGSGPAFMKALRGQRVDVGMNTEPTASHLLASGEARLLVDLRTPQATLAALGGSYPSACLYMQAAWVNRHPEMVQRLVNALVKALRFIQTHSAAEILARMPPDESPDDRVAYLHVLESSRAMYSPDGLMPEDGPPMVLKVQTVVNRPVRERRIDLGKTYTNAFALAVPAASP